MKPKILIGGQAVIEGVMMRSPNFVTIAVRKPNNKITVKKERIKSFAEKVKLFKLPFFRGILALIETLVIGIKALNYSANESAENDAKLTGFETGTTIIFALGFAVLLFVVLPLYLTGLVSESRGFVFNLVDGIIRIVIFLIYLIVISSIKDVKETFKYHGAEHKAVYCYEAGKSLTVKNAKKYSTLHPRCGTSFIIIVLVISILIFSLIVSPKWHVRFIARLALLPVIAGVSYEFLRFSAKHRNNIVINALIKPGLWLQKLTTKEPNSNQIKVALIALKSALNLEKKVSK